MPHIVRSPEAVEDVLDIAERIARDNFVAALNCIDEIDRTTRRLAECRGVGPYRPVMGPPLHSLPVGKYLFVYPQVPGGIEFFRGVHGARTLVGLFRRFRP